MSGDTADVSDNTSQDQETNSYIGSIHEQDEEAGGDVVVSEKFLSDEATAAAGAASSANNEDKKRRRRVGCFVGGMTMFLIVVGLAVGLSTRTTTMGKTDESVATATVAVEDGGGMEEGSKEMPPPATSTFRDDDSSSISTTSALPNDDTSTLEAFLLNFNRTEDVPSSPPTQKTTREPTDSPSKIREQTFESRTNEPTDSALPSKNPTPGPSNLPSNGPTQDTSKQLTSEPTIEQPTPPRLSNAPPVVCPDPDDPSYPMLDRDPDGPFKRCTGDCDNNAANCVEGLVCFQRSNNGPNIVPGCRGTVVDNTDYCVEPQDLASYLHLAELGEAEMYQKCQGSCDTDDECAGNLQCFQRSGQTRLSPVPGCCGTGRGGADYCYDPNDEVGVTAPTVEEASSTPSASPITRPTLEPTSEPQTNELVCPDPDDPSYPILDRDPDGPFKRCTGDCDNNVANCEEGLVCYQRSNNGPDIVPGCRGTVVDDIDYCVEPQDLASYLHLAKLDEAEKYQKCQGSCDNDDECAGNLRCFQRSGQTRLSPVPGCCGTGRGGADYCYDPNDEVGVAAPTVEVGTSSPSKEAPSTLSASPMTLPTLEPTSKPQTNELMCPDPDDPSYPILESNAVGPFDRCAGDCDSNAANCAEGLVCYQRSNNGPDIVPGCRGAAVDNIDYCVEPKYLRSYLHHTEVGNNGQYQKCQGSCDTDDECAGNLLCFQRSGQTRLSPVPGCCGTGRGGADYCYDPNDEVGVDEPTVGSDDLPGTPPVSDRPTKEPTPRPIEGSSSQGPTQAYLFGDEFVTHEELGIKVSRGLSVRLIATKDEKVKYANGGESQRKYHRKTDAAGIIPLNTTHPTEGGYVYVSNAERDNGLGGVYGIYFNKVGDITEYKALLTKTTKNCGGGLTPWHTWVSCEEYPDGQCWQVDPNPNSEFHETPQETVLGGGGGQYESVAVDISYPSAPVFFVTEDIEDGALRRFVANGNGWNSLHSGGNTKFLHIIDDSTYQWTTNETVGRESARKYFKNAEGISYHEGKLYFMAKKTKTLIILDLVNFTYETEKTGMKFYGEGSFGDQPDQILHGPWRKYIYFCEDGGPNPGVYARHGDDGTYFTLFQGIDGRYDNDETIGIAISPGGKRLMAGIQDAGIILELTREDGLPFE